MQVSEFKSLAGAPDLPPELADTDLIEDYLIRLFLHGSRAESAYLGEDSPNRRWKFYIDQSGVVRGEVKLPVSVDVQVQ